METELANLSPADKDINEKKIEKKIEKSDELETPEDKQKPELLEKETTLEIEKRSSFEVDKKDTKENPSNLHSQVPDADKTEASKHNDEPEFEKAENAEERKKLQLLELISGHQEKTKKGGVLLIF